ncbi:MAG: hypothetical protein PVG03_05485 [Desulfarculaceae bacterium]
MLMGEMPPEFCTAKEAAALMPDAPANENEFHLIRFQGPICSV